MTISSINTSFPRDLGIPNSNKSRAGEAAVAFAMPASATSAPTPSPAVASASPAGPVQFSSDTNAIAQLASQGVSMRTVSFKPLSEQQAGSQASSSSEGGVLEDGSVSKSAFENLVAQYGGSAVQADQLFSSFDANGDGSISQSEFLSGIGKLTGANSNTPFAQSVGSLMDDHGNRDGVVSESEFVGFETAFLNTETATTAGAPAANGAAATAQGKVT
jgi:Ca2+-binding EF-hand superfamily protein